MTSHDLLELLRAERFYEREHAISAVQSEPELPGGMPDALWATLLQSVLMNDRALLAELLRATVKRTKTNIVERIRAQS